MKRIIITVAAALALSSVSAQVNSPSSIGTLVRAEKMYGDRNFHGCLDQLSAVDTEVLAPEGEQRVAYLRAMATVHIDKASARLMLENFLVKYPNSAFAADVRMGIADCVYGSDYETALALYQKVNRNALTPARQAELDFRMAYCMMRTERSNQALPLFASLAGNSQYGNASRFYQGYIFFSRGDYRSARPLLEGVGPAAPGNLAPVYLSQIYYFEGDCSKALDCARRFLSAVPVEADAMQVAETKRIAGESLYHLGDIRLALPYLKEYVAAVDAPQPSALYILGVEAFNDSNYRQALEYLRPVTSLDDAMGQSANLFVGQSLMKEADYDGAIIAFDRALNMNHDLQVKETAYYNYAVAHTMGGNVPFGSVVATFRNFLKAFPKSQYAPRVQEFVINSYITDNNYQDALDGINEMTAPSEATMAAKQQVLYVLGGRLLTAGETERALRLLDEAKTLARYSAETDREVALLRGEASYSLDDFLTSERELKRYLASAPLTAENRPLALYDLGYTLFAQKKYAEAAKNFSSAIDRPGSLTADIVSDAWNRFGDCLYYDSNFSAAAQAYQKAYDTNPQAGDYALFQQALMKGYARDYDGKIALLTRLEKDFPASPLVPDALLETTESYIQQGDNARAIDVYRHLVDRYPNTAQGRQGYLQMALTMLNSGRRQEAISTYRQVISRYPTSEEAAFAVAELKRISAADGTLPEYLEFLASVPDAPQVDPSEAEKLSFEAAEQDYIENSESGRLEKYLSEYPAGAHRPQALNYLIELAEDAGNTDAAYSYAAEIIERHPDTSYAEDALRVVAEIDMEQGRGNAAMRAWEKMAEKASTPAGLVYARMGMMRTARDIADYDRLLSASESILASTAAGADDRNEAVFSKALALSHKGRTAEAQELWKSIAGHTDDLYGIKSAVALAANQLGNRQLDAAEQTAESVTASGSQHAYWVARAFIVLADVYAARGNDFKARQYLISLRDNYPGNEPDLILMIEQRLEK